LPIAASDRREGPLVVDGSLGDWHAADAIQDGPLVRMLDRPGVAAGATLRLTQSAAKVYTTWAQDRLYVAFSLAGVTQPDFHAVRNFVDYQQRRAWGEDVCELLFQPVYADNTLGPVLHVACKPTGQWVERKPDPDAPAGDDGSWSPLEGVGVRYATTVDQGVWRGELAIPWLAVHPDPAKGRPRLMRFNFAQHRTRLGESGSWAGPVDFGRDDRFMGLLVIRDEDWTPKFSSSTNSR
jgi:hypothetical protein